MKDSDKRLIVEFVGLEWHETQKTTIPSEVIGQPENFICSCGFCVTWQYFEVHIKENQLDPLSPADMYGKIWPAFEEDSDKYYEFLDWLGVVTKGTLSQASLVNLVTSPELLAQALLEYVKEKGNG
jgi:hypothetical protein